MNKELTIANNSVQQVDRITFTEDQLNLIRSQIAPKANPNELALFLHQCKRTGLDPLARQIYCIHLAGKMTIQTSIDGFRVIAERSGDYAGQDAPEFMEQDGRLIACRVTVYRFRGEQRYPAAVGVAYMAEYSTGQSMWNKMPHTMLAKCAEAQALRKAYPQDLSGLYTSDEMEQAQEAPQPVTQEAQLVHAEEMSSLDQWKDEVAKCTDKETLGALYKSNKATVDGSPEIKALFAEQKQKLAA